MQRSRASLNPKQARRFARTVSGNLKGRCTSTPPLPSRDRPGCHRAQHGPKPLTSELPVGVHTDGAGVVRRRPRKLRQRLGRGADPRRRFGTIRDVPHVLGESLQRARGERGGPGWCSAQRRKRAWPCVQLGRDRGDGCGRMGTAGRGDGCVCAGVRACVRACVHMHFARGYLR